MGKAEESLKEKLCFIIGPIGSEGTPTRDNADWVAHAVELALSASGYGIQRADKIKTPGLITDQVIDFIDRASVIIADLAELNPNAFYELGVAHAARKAVVHVYPAGQRLPFDIQEYRAVEYRLNSPAEISRFAQRLSEQVRELEKQKEAPSNPVSRARGLQGLANTGDDKDQIISGLISQLSSIDSRLRSIEAAQMEDVIDYNNISSMTDLGRVYTKHLLGPTKTKQQMLAEILLRSEAAHAKPSSIGELFRNMETPKKSSDEK